MNRKLNHSLINNICGAILSTLICISLILDKIELIYTVIAVSSIFALGYLILSITSYFKVDSKVGNVALISVGLYVLFILFVLFLLVFFYAGHSIGEPFNNYN